MRQDLKTNYKARGKLGTVAELINRIHRILNGFTGFDGIEIEYSGDETRFFFRRPTGGGMNLSKFAFGVLKVGTDESPLRVEIREGFAEGRYGYIGITGATVNVGGNESHKHLIIVTGNESAGEIAADTVSEENYNSDAEDEAKWRRVLYRVYVKNGRVVLDMIGASVGGVIL